MIVLTRSGSPQFCAQWFDRTRYLISFDRLRILDRLVGPMTETAADRTITGERERLRQAFPQLDFDDPGRHKR